MYQHKRDYQLNDDEVFRDLAAHTTVLPDTIVDEQWQSAAVQALKLQHIPLTLQDALQEIADRVGPDLYSLGRHIGHPVADTSRESWHEPGDTDGDAVQNSTKKRSEAEYEGEVGAEGVVDEAIAPPPTVKDEPGGEFLAFGDLDGWEDDGENSPGDELSDTAGRYFVECANDEENESEGLATKVLHNPADVQKAVAVARRYIRAAGKTTDKKQRSRCRDNALLVLARALEENAENIDVWILYLKTFADREQNKQMAPQAKELCRQIQLCDSAVEAMVVALSGKASC